MSAARRVRDALSRPTDASGLGAFRLIFGTLLAVAVARTWAMEWIYTFYVAPEFHFTYLGFSWVRPLPYPWIYGHFGALGLSALALALGVRPRLAAVSCFVLFTWVELSEKALYLNHYYLVSIVCLLLAVLPAGRALSVDAWWQARRGRDERGGAERGGAERGGAEADGVARGDASRAASSLSVDAKNAPGRVPHWCYTLLRGQVAIVYVFAGFAKLNPDWLLRGEPLTTWLTAHAGVPLIGPLLATPGVGVAMCWAGALFDLTLPLWMSWRRTRAPAFLVAVGFHVTVGLLFPIGMFSWFMVGALTLFFPPDWPLRLRRRFGAGGTTSGATNAPRRPVESASPATAQRVPVFAIALWLTVQTLVPLRFVLYPGPVNWTEEAFRFSWRVMLVEKTGTLEYRVVEPDGRSFRVFPNRELPEFQARMLRTQPDMIVQWAHEIDARHPDDVAVYADAWVSWNGRRATRSVDPNVDLSEVSLSLRPATWLQRQPAPLPPER